MTSEAEKLRELEERLSALEQDRTGNGRRLADLRGFLERLVPVEVRRHLRTAQREQLLAARAYLDHVIERIDDEDASRERAAPRRVNVD